MLNRFNFARKYLECAFLDWWASSAIVWSGRIKSIGEINAVTTSERIHGIIKVNVRIDIRGFSVWTKSAQWWSHLQKIPELKLFSVNCTPMEFIYIFIKFIDGSIDWAFRHTSTAYIEESVFCDGAFSTASGIFDGLIVEWIGTENRWPSWRLNTLWCKWSS